MACFEESMVDIGGGVVAVHGGIYSEYAVGGQVKLGGYGSVRFNPLPLVLVIVKARCGAKEFVALNDNLGCLLCGEEDLLVHIGEDAAFGEMAHLDYGEA